MLVVGCWLNGVPDSYRGLELLFKGSKVEKSNRSTVKKSNG